jgi:hypothetical protein
MLNTIISKQSKSKREKNSTVHIIDPFEEGRTVCEIRVNHLIEEYQGKIHSIRDCAPTCNVCLSETARSLRRKGKEIALEDMAETFQEIFGNLVRIAGGKVCHPNLEVEERKSKYRHKKHDAGFWSFIPHSAGDNYRLFKSLRDILAGDERWGGHRGHERRFLDAGCGIGNQMMLASHTLKGLGQYHGLEFFPDTIKQACNFLGLVEIGTTLGHRAWANHIDADKARFMVMKADIMKFENYKDYDIIYFYCPFEDHRRQNKFENRLADEMKVGAVVVPRLSKRNWREDERFETLRAATGPALIKVKN